jgi:hypothetical protein
VSGDVSEEMCKQNSRGKARQQATRDGFGRALCTKARSNLPELPNTPFTFMIPLVLNGKNMVLAPNQLQASYTNVRHREELVDYINKNGRPKEPYILRSMFKCILVQD